LSPNPKKCKPDKSGRIFKGRLNLKMSGLPMAVAMMFIVSAELAYTPF
jgi:hypothetical protein